jgi:Domain of unknown function (DUF4349)
MHSRFATALVVSVLLAAACEKERSAHTTATAPAPSPPVGYQAVRPREDAPASRSGVVADTAAVAMEQLSADRPAPASAQARDSAAAPPMLIRTGSATIEVDSLEPAVARVRQLAQQLGGFVASTTMQTGREQLRSATLELKLPAPRWQQAVSGLAPIGRVEALSEETADVGEEYVDVSARVANARRLEQRLVDLLARRTGKLEDVLAVERELARVREGIERFEGRLRYLRARVALSTLTVTVHEPRPIVGDYPGASVIGGAFEQSWRNFVGFLAALIASLGVLIPLGLIAGAGWFVVRRVRERAPTRTGDKAANDAP